MIDRPRQKRPLFDPSGQSRRGEVPMEKARVSAPKRGQGKPLGGVALARSITGMIVGAVALGFLVASVGALVLDVVGSGTAGGYGFASLDRDETRPLAGELTENSIDVGRPKRGERRPPQPGGAEAKTQTLWVGMNVEVRRTDRDDIWRTRYDICPMLSTRS